MNVTPSLDFTTLEPTKKSLTAYANMLQKMWRNLALAVNSKILHFDTVPSGNALTGDLAIDDTTGNLYVWYNGSWIPVSSSSKNFWEYTADTTVTSGDPGKGDIAWNNVSQIAATALLISETTQDSLDVTLFLNLIANGDTIIIQDSGDSTNNQIWTVNGTPTVNPTYYSVPVTLSSSSGTGTTGFANNAKLIMAHFSAGGSSGVSSLAGLTGALTLGSSDSSVTITPSGTNIDLKSTGGTLGTQNGGFSKADIIPGSPTSYDDEFNGSSLDVKWSWINQGLSTATVGNNVLTLVGDNSGHVWRGIYQALPAGNWAFAAKMVLENSLSGNYTLSGLFLRESSTDKTVWFGPFMGTWNVYVGHGTAGSAVNTYDYAGPTYSWLASNYYKITYDGTNLNFYISKWGIQYGLVKTIAVTADFTTAPDQIGLGFSLYPPGNGNLVVDWFRKTA